MIFIFTAPAPIRRFLVPQIISHSHSFTWSRAKIDILLNTHPQGSIRLWFCVALFSALGAARSGKRVSDTAFCAFEKCAESREQLLDREIRQKIAGEMK